MMKEKCLNPHCDRRQTAKGLCKVCYTVALQLIKQNRTSWKKLEQEGKSLPKMRERSGTTVNWLLNNEHTTNTTAK